jgi:hypothetical protein
VLPAQCTAWLVENQPNAFLSAGHCSIAAGSVVQFNVPASSVGGSMRHPPPEHQYPVDAASMQTQSGNIGIGNDWRYFGVFPNCNTGLGPMQVQQDSFRISPTVPPADGRLLRVTGYGMVSQPMPLSFNYVLTTHTGLLQSSSNNTINHLVDTTGGNSGAPVIDEVTGLAIGVHTNGVCNSNGANRATATRNPGLRAAVASPTGMAATKDGLTFSSPVNRPAIIDPAGGTPVMVRVSDSLTRSVAGDEVTLHVLDGSTWMAIPMEFDPSGNAVATFPLVAQCAGPVQYYFSAVNNLGEMDTWPRSAPTQAFVAIAAGSTNAYVSHDFQAAEGWTFWGHAALTSGRFKVGKPLGGDLYAPHKDFDGSTRCLMTGSNMYEDVDNGATRTSSPPVNLALANDPVLHFAAWFATSLPLQRSMTVQLSADGGASWLTIDTITQTDGWEMRAYRLLDHIPLTSEVRVRFETDDPVQPSIVEAAIDRFRIEDLSCEPCNRGSSSQGPQEADVLRRLTLFNAGDLEADVNDDGVLDIFDLIELLRLPRASNCP